MNNKHKNKLMTKLFDMLDIAFRHSLGSDTCGFVIIEKAVTREEYEKCVRLLEEWTRVIPSNVKRKTISHISRKSNVHL